jgi:hypothetical protein
MDYSDDLHDIVETAAVRLLAVTPEASARRPGAGKWSAREIIGHLIDSASNNHQRFVRSQFRDDLVFPGYEQEQWVAVQKYNDAPWSELVTLWRTFNLHLARVMDAVPQAERLRPRTTHNLYEIATNGVPADEPATLDYFMRDYVEHLKQHLRQIDATLGDRRG